MSLVRLSSCGCILAATSRLSVIVFFSGVRDCRPGASSVECRAHSKASGLDIHVCEEFGFLLGLCMPSPDTDKARTRPMLSRTSLGSSITSDPKSLPSVPRSSKAMTITTCMSITFFSFFLPSSVCPPSCFPCLCVFFLYACGLFSLWIALSFPGPNTVLVSRRMFSGLDQARDGSQCICMQDRTGQDIGSRRLAIYPTSVCYLAPCSVGPHLGSQKGMCLGRGRQ